MTTKPITTNLPYFAATFDCDWLVARNVARRTYQGDELAAHLAAISAAEVRAFVESKKDDDAIDDDELRRIFRLAYGRMPDAQDEAAGLWSLICAAV